MASLKRKAVEKQQNTKPKKLPRPAEDSLSSEEEVVLHGFSSDEDDSSDDEPAVFDVEKLPTVAKDDAAVKRKLEKAQRQQVCFLSFTVSLNKDRRKNAESCTSDVCLMGSMKTN